MTTRIRYRLGSRDEVVWYCDKFSLWLKVAIAEAEALGDVIRATTLREIAERFRNEDFPIFSDHEAKVRVKGPFSRFPGC